MQQNTNQQRKKILWLASWYPNKADLFTGDFIQRHAYAASLLNDIHVLHVAVSTRIVPAIEETVNKNEGLTEHIIYYREPKSIWGKLSKQVIWFRLYQKSIKLYIAQNGIPIAVHLHVAWKAGLIALWLKFRYKIPYVITEHWGMYNNVVKDNFFQKSLAVQLSIRRIFYESSHLATVSQFIANSIKGWMRRPQLTYTPNVVDISYFHCSQIKHQKFTFIHVSTLIPLKNVKGILKAFQSISDHPNFKKVQLIIIGNKDNSYQQYALSLGIEQKVTFKGEITYQEVGEEMKKCHCLIVNSLMENAPCVISEAHCCGLPVIATRVGGIPEMIDESNGILIEPADDDSLAKGILKIFENYEKFDPIAISAHAAQKYGYTVVSDQFDQIYSSL